MASFPRLRYAGRKGPSPCLERGELGLDGMKVKMTRKEMRSLMLLQCGNRTMFVACVSLMLFLAYAINLSRQNAISSVREYVSTLSVSDACQPVRSEWMNVVYVRDGEYVMTKPRIVSRVVERVKTSESSDTPECADKKILRERHTAVTVAYVPLDGWPWGRESFVTLRDDVAVCAQHALEMLAAKSPCEIN